MKKLLLSLLFAAAAVAVNAAFQLVTPDPLAGSFAGPAIEVRRHE